MSQNSSLATNITKLKPYSKGNKFKLGRNISRRNGAKSVLTTLNINKNKDPILSKDNSGSSLTPYDIKKLKEEIFSKSTIQTYCVPFDIKHNNSNKLQQPIHDRSPVLSGNKLYT